MSRPTVTEARELIQTAGRMSKGAALPKAARTEATVVGRSWMEAVLSTTSRHSSSLAAPPQFRAIRRAAWMPSGVAALPRPRRFAETLAETAASVSSSRLALGSRRRSSGQNLHDAAPKAEDAGHGKAQLQSGLGTVQRGGGYGTEISMKKAPEEGEDHQTGPDIRHCHRSTLPSIDFEKWVHCTLCGSRAGHSEKCKFGVLSQGIFKIREVLQEK